MSRPFFVAKDVIGGGGASELLPRCEGDLQVRSDFFCPRQGRSLQHDTLLRASEALVGFRNLDEQSLRLAVSYEASKLARVLSSFLPRLIRRCPG